MEWMLSVAPVYMTGPQICALQETRTRCPTDAESSVVPLSCFAEVCNELLGFVDIK